MLDAIIAVLYGLGEDDFRWILADCDHPSEKVCEKPFSRALDPKGFWRVDKDKDPELRHTVLSQIAFYDLQQDIAAHGGEIDVASVMGQGTAFRISLPRRTQEPNVNETSPSHQPAHNA